MPANIALVRGVQVFVIAGALLGGAVRAEDNALTLYGSYRDGGNFTNVDTDQSLRIEGSGAGAISYDWGIDPNRQMQLYLSQQRSHLNVAQTAAPALSGELPMNVTYLQIGGTSFFTGTIGKGPYLVGGIGATLFEPDASGFSDELRASMNVGLGYQLPLGEHVALRFEARGYLTFVNSAGGLFCSGGNCLVAIKGEAVAQGELQFGLSFRY